MNDECAQIFKKHKYEIVRLLSNKTRPSVYLVRSLRYNMEFVIKVQNVVDFFNNEVNSLSHLEQSNIIRLYDYFSEGEHFFLVLEYCPNGNLEVMIKENDKPTTEKALGYIAQLIEGVSFIHKAKIAHRNLKPSSIFINNYDKLKIGDFIFSGSYPSNMCTTYTGILDYMAPEVKEKKPYDPFVADSWGIGLIISYLMFGCILTLSNEKLEKFISLSSIPDEVKLILNGALKEKPEERMTVSQMMDIIKPKQQHNESQKRSSQNSHKLNAVARVNPSSFSQVYRYSEPRPLKPF